MFWGACAPKLRGSAPCEGVSTIRLSDDPGISESLARFIAYLCHDETSITGCVLSGLLTARYGFRPTIGSLSTQDVLDHVEALRKLGFAGGRLRCDG